jgi:hypothetical protein
MLAQLLAGESAIDDLVVNHETGSSGKLARDAFERHAFDEAHEQINAGNLDIELDTAEERDRLARARWFSVPAHLQGKRGDFIIGEDARVKIAPMPRFENWVRILKKYLLEEDRKKAQVDPGLDATDEHE